MLRLIQLIKREMRLNASAILFVSLSAVGADKLDEPKLLKSKAKKRLSTCKDTSVVGERMHELWTGRTLGRRC